MKTSRIRRGRSTNRNTWLFCLKINFRMNISVCFIHLETTLPTHFANHSIITPLWTFPCEMLTWWTDFRTWSTIAYFDLIHPRNWVPPMSRWSQFILINSLWLFYLAVHIPAILNHVTLVMYLIQSPIEGKNGWQKSTAAHKWQDASALLHINGTSD